MVKKNISILFSIFWALSFIYFPVIASKINHEESTPRRGYNGFYDLSKHFKDIIRVPPEEYIDLQFKNDLHYEARKASGTYQLIPYYQKVSFPANNQDEDKDSKFIIQKDPLTEEWKLIEIYDYVIQKEIYPTYQTNSSDEIHRSITHGTFHKEENVLKPLIVAKVFETLKKEAQQMKQLNSELMKDLGFKNIAIQNLSHEIESIKNNENKALVECESKTKTLTQNFQQEINKKEEAHKKLQHSNKALKSKYNLYEKININLKSKIKELEESLKNSLLENVNMNKEKLELQKELDEQAKEYINLQNHQIDFGNQIKKLEQKKKLKLIQVEFATQTEFEFENDVKTEQDASINFETIEQNKIQHEKKQNISESEAKENDDNIALIEMNAILQILEEKKFSQIETDATSEQNQKKQETNENGSKNSESKIQSNANGNANPSKSKKKKKKKTKFDSLQNEMEEKAHFNNSKKMENNTDLDDSKKLENNTDLDSPKIKNTLAKEYKQFVKGKREEIEINFKNFKDPLRFQDEKEGLDWFDKYWLTIEIGMPNPEENQYESMLAYYGATRFVIHEENTIDQEIKLFSDQQEQKSKGSNLENWWTQKGKRVYKKILHLQNINCLFNVGKLCHAIGGANIDLRKFTNSFNRSDKTDYEEVFIKIGYMKAAKESLKLFVEKTEKEFLSSVDILEPKSEKSFQSESHLISAPKEENEDVITEDTLNLSKIDTELSCKINQKVNDIDPNASSKSKMPDVYDIEKIKEEKIKNTFSDIFVEFLQEKRNVEAFDLIQKIAKVKDNHVRSELNNIYRLTNMDEIDWMDVNNLSSFLYVHDGALVHANKHLSKIDTLFEEFLNIFPSENYKMEVKCWWKTQGLPIYIGALSTIKEIHQNALKLTLESSTKKTKTLYTILKQKPILIENPKYEYQKLLLEIGYVLQGSSDICKTFTQF